MPTKRNASFGEDVILLFFFCAKGKYQIGCKTHFSLFVCLFVFGFISLLGFICSQNEERNSLILSTSNKANLSFQTTLDTLLTQGLYLGKKSMFENKNKITLRSYKDDLGKNF